MQTVTRFVTSRKKKDGFRGEDRNKGGTGEVAWGGGGGKMMVLTESQAEQTAGEKQLSATQTEETDLTACVVSPVCVQL